MIKLEIGNNLDWILQNLDAPKTGDDWKGNFISHLLPDKFERYIKILHSIYEDSSITDKKTTWNQTEQDKIQKLLDDPVKNLLTHATMTFSTPDEDFEGTRVKWIDLAGRYKVPFKKTINVNTFIHHFPQNSFPRYLVGPTKGILESHENKELIKILNSCGSNSECYFYYDALVFGDFERVELYKGKLSELIDLTNKHEWSSGYSPTYIWSSNKDWCLNTDYDLSFSVMGCTGEIAEKLLSSEILEAIEVDRKTRIDYKADEP